MTATLAKFPTTLGELHSAAEADLTKPVNGVLLKWSFWHAQAEGFATAAAVVQRQLYDRERDVRQRLLYTVMPASMQDEAALHMPDPRDKVRVEEALVESTAMVRACAHVIELLRRRMQTRPSR